MRGAGSGAPGKPERHVEFRTHQTGALPFVMAAAGPDGIPSRTARVDGVYFLRRRMKSLPASAAGEVDDARWQLPLQALP